MIPAKLPAKITVIKKKHGRIPKRHLMAERMGNAINYFSKTDWSADELREKASSIAIRLLGLNEAMQRKHGKTLLTPALLEQLTSLSHAFLPEKFEGYKPRRLTLQRLTRPEEKQHERG